MHLTDRSIIRPWGLVVAVASFVGCADSRSPIDPPLPDLALVVVDTLRADRLPFYGCPVETAPFLNELARRSLVFESSWSPSSWTLPATVSMLTSVHPHQHGVIDLVGLELGPDDEPVPVNTIPDEVMTLAERLRDAGYRTYGIASNVLMTEAVGVHRGFDRFVTLDDEPADAVNALLASWREEILIADTPWFVYLHYIDPHDPFHAREPWFDAAHGRVDAGWPATLPTDAEDFAFLDWMRDGQLRPGPDGIPDVPSAELSPVDHDRVMTWMRSAYDSEIGYLDSRLREAWEMLGLEDAAVVVTADHGEEFFEHGELTHGFDLHGESTRVPLLLHLPGAARSGRIAAPVSTLDVAPTLASLAGLPALPPGRDQFQGRDLLADGARPPVLGALEIDPEGATGPRADQQTQASIVVGDHRLLLSGDGARLYDLATDQLEQHDLAAERPDLVAELRAELERRRAEAPPYPRTRRLPDSGPSDSLLEHLRGIGYMGDR